MKYRLEFPPNPNCISIHVDKRVTDKHFLSYDDCDATNFDGTPMKAYVKSLFTIAGVESVTLHQHEVGFEKGTMFSWKEMLPMIISTINGELDPENEAVEQTPPHCWTLDGRGHQRDASDDYLVSAPSDLDNEEDED